MIDLDQDTSVHLCQASDVIEDIPFIDLMYMIVLKHDKEFNPIVGGDEYICHVAVEFVVQNQVLVSLQFKHLYEAGNLVLNQCRGVHIVGFMVWEGFLDLHLDVMNSLLYIL